ncbi:MAG: hypothetical protein ABTQ26_05625 [Azonexus sp.]
MDTMTTAKFVKRLKKAGPKSTGEFSECYMESYMSYEHDIPLVRGSIWNELDVDGLVITCMFWFEHPKYKPSKVKITEDLDNQWDFLYGRYRVIDDRGNRLSARELGEIIMEYIDMESLDLSVLGEDEIEEIDLEENVEMETIVVERVDDRNIKFKGEVVASASSSGNRVMHDFSGETGRWKELTLYKTAGGKFVCEQIDRTIWRGDSDFSRGAVCDDVDDVISYFGDDWLANRLYENAGIDD